MRHRCRFTWSSLSVGSGHLLSALAFEHPKKGALYFHRDSRVQPSNAYATRLNLGLTYAYALPRAWQRLAQIPNKCYNITVEYLTNLSVAEIKKILFGEARFITIIIISARNPAEFGGPNLPQENTLRTP